MKFLPQNKKKTIGLLAVLLLTIAGIISVNFGGSEPAEKTAPQESPLPITSSSGRLVPFSREIDLKLLDTDKFKTLRAPVGISVTAEELGKTNLFAP